MVIAPGLALGHTVPTRRQAHLLQLDHAKESVNFGVPENDPFDVVFCFAAPNKEEHMSALREMALFCCDGSNLDFIRTAATPQQVRESLIKFFKDEKNF